MTRRNLTTVAVATAIGLLPVPGASQTVTYGVAHGGGEGGPHLHISNRWKECSIQLDPSLTQSAWRQFAQEAGLVAYFRPLSDAKPMGKGHFEISVLQWQTKIDDHDAAWNDTFVHPDSTHWLFDGEEGLAFPGLTGRVGVGDKTDLGVYFTKNPNANYGFYGAQLQQNFFARSAWAASARLSFTNLYGPEDVDLTVLGADIVASREIPVNSWIIVSPYAGVSSYFSMAREKSNMVDLDDENQGGSQAMVGAAVKLSGVRLAMEYNVAKVNSVSMKVGFGR